MTDDKKSSGGQGNPDEQEWDEALSEWDNKTFVPEIARDTSTDKPAPPVSVSKPLYRPPVPPQAKPRPPVPAAAKKPVVPAPPTAAPALAAPPAPPPPRPPLERLDELVEEEEGATVIAAIPRELLRGEDTGPKSSSRGGLGQMFAREEKRDASVEVSFEESQPKQIASPRLEPPSDVFTSAKPVVPSRPDAAEAMPLRRPPVVDATENVHEGGMFDPFADPEPRSAQSTRPAEDEVDDLLAQAPSSSPVPGEAESQPFTPPAPETLQQTGPALLAPEARNYDPNEETMVGKDADLARAREAIAARRATAAVPVPTHTWPDEKPASAWLGEDARGAFTSRAAWLEQEARASTDKVARARGLLVCSEIHATLGERDRAYALAVEARDLAPSLGLAHRQVRALMPQPVDPAEHLAALDAEVKMTPAGPARVHSMLLTVDALRAAGDEDGTSKRLDQAARIGAGDVRAVILRAVRALARNEVSSATLRLPEGVEDLAPVADALQLALRLRGVERKDSPAAAPSPNETLLRVRAALDRGDVGTAVPLVSQLTSVPELAAGATWLAASLAATTPARRTDSARLLRELVERGDAAAPLALVSRALEMQDQETVSEAVRGPSPLSSAERMTLAVLAGVPVTPSDPHMDATASAPGMQSIVAALAAVATVGSGEDRAEQVGARAQRTAGGEPSRTLVALGRLLGSSGPADQIEGTLASLGDHQSPSARAVALEMAIRAGRTLEVSRGLESWGGARGSGEERASASMAAAMVAERGGGDRPRHRGVPGRSGCRPHERSRASRGGFPRATRSRGRVELAGRRARRRRARGGHAHRGRQPRRRGIARAHPRGAARTRPSRSTLVAHRRLPGRAHRPSRRRD